MPFNMTPARKKPWPYPMSLNQLAQIIENYKQPERALASFLYLYAARVSEATNFLAGDLIAETYLGKKVLVAKDLPTLKNKKHKTRSLVVTVNGVEGIMAIDLAEYADQIMPDVKLFELSRQQAYNRISKQTATIKVRKPNGKMGLLENFKIHPHYFRHCRAAHLVTHHHFDEISLMRFMGWSSPVLAETYVHMDWQDFARRMIG